MPSREMCDEYILQVAAHQGRRWQLREHRPFMSSPAAPARRRRTPSYAEMPSDAGLTQERMAAGRAMPGSAGWAVGATAAVSRR